MIITLGKSPTFSDCCTSLTVISRNWSARQVLFCPRTAINTGPESQKRGGGLFHNKGAYGCAVCKGILFRTASLAKGILFGDFGQRKVEFWKFLFRSQDFGEGIKLAIFIQKAPTRGIFDVEFSLAKGFIFIKLVYSTVPFGTVGGTSNLAEAPIRDGIKSSQNIGRFVDAIMQSFFLNFLILSTYDKCFLSFDTFLVLVPKLTSFALRWF